MGIGDRIKQLRKDKGITQEELAKQTGISRVTLGFYERNENLPPVDAIYAMAKFFNVSTDYLLGLVDNASWSIEDIAATEIYGLDKNALNILRIMKSVPVLNYLPQINALFAADAKFRNLLRAMRDYQAEAHRKSRCLSDSDIEKQPELTKYKDMATGAALDLLADDQPAIMAIAESFAKNYEANEANDRSMIYLFKAQQLLLSIIEGTVKEPD